MNTTHTEREQHTPGRQGTSREARPQAHSKQRKKQRANTYNNTNKKIINNNSILVYGYLVRAVGGLARTNKCSIKKFSRRG